MEVSRHRTTKTEVERSYIKDMKEKGVKTEGVLHKTGERGE